MKYILSIIFTLFITFSFAQRPGGGFPPNGKKGFKNMKIAQVSGRVMDNNTDKPVEFASVAIYNARKDSLITGTITDKKGYFVLEKLPFGRFFVKVDFIGYETASQDSIRLNPKQKEVDLGKVYLFEKTALLNEVSVTAEKELFKNDIDKKVYNVDKSVVTEGGAAADVLKNIPSVDVDFEGALTVRGNGNVRILIDGKPSNLSGDAGSALDQIPASSIEKIEVITNPSAKYDADGMAGIINIVLKKDRKKGLNGNVSIGYGTWERYNGSFGLNYNTKKFNLFTNYSYRDNSYGWGGTTDRQTTVSGLEQILKQERDANGRRAGHVAKVGGDFNITPKSTFGISTTFGYNIRQGDNIVNSDNYAGNDSLIYRELFDNIGDNNRYNIDLNTYYEKKFATSDQILSYDGTVSYGDRNGDDQNIVIPLNLSGEQINTINPTRRTNNKNNQIIISQALDYFHPLNENSKVETGIKYNGRLLKTDFFTDTLDVFNNNYLADSSQINKFNFDEHVLATYGTYSRAFGKFSMNVGMRLEYALTTSHLVNEDQTFDNNYFSYYPSIFLSQKLANEQELKLSYSKRVNRPNSRTLNPFIQYSNPQDLRFGNPFLKPEYIHSTELSYSKNFKKINISAGIYYKEIVDVIRRQRRVDEEGIASSTFVNLDRGRDYGAELILNFKPTDTWRINLSGNFYRSELDGEDSEFSNSGYSYSTKFLSSWTIIKGLDVQVSGRYNGRRVHSQGEIDPFFSIDLGVKKSLFKGKGSLSLRASDIFNTFEFGFNSTGANYYQESTWKRESRVLFLTFSYRFGKRTMTKRRKKSNNFDNGGGGGPDL